LGYVKKSADDSTIQFPLHPFNEDQLKLFMGGRSIRILDRPKDWQEAIDEKHLVPDIILNEYVNQNGIPLLWLNNRPAEISSALFTLCRREYAAINDNVAGSDPRQTMEEAVSDWNSLLSPLLPLRVDKKDEVASQLFYACSIEYQDLLHEVFGEKIRTAQEVTLRCKSRVYFYNVLPDVKIDEVIKS